MQGRFLEACDCFVPCPCWFQQAPSEGECTGLMAWQIEQGEIDGVDVSGLSAVSVSHHGGHRDDPHQMRVALFVDAAGSDEQREALGRTFTGKLGGPLKELGDLMPAAADEVVPTKITYTTDGARTRVAAGKQVRTRTKLLRGSTKRPISVADGRLATLLGTPAEFGEASEFKVDVAEIHVDRTGRSTSGGRFSYAHGH
jgi:hypothetical protein